MRKRKCAPPSNKSYYMPRLSMPYSLTRGDKCFVEGYLESYEDNKKIIKKIDAMSETLIKVRDVDRRSSLQQQVDVVEMALGRWVREEFQSMCLRLGTEENYNWNNVVSDEKYKNYELDYLQTIYQRFWYGIASEAGLILDCND